MASQCPLLITTHGLQVLPDGGYQLYASLIFTMSKVFEHTLVTILSMGPVAEWLQTSAHKLTLLKTHRRKTHRCSLNTE